MRQFNIAFLLRAPVYVMPLFVSVASRDQSSPSMLILGFVVFVTLLSTIHLRNKIRRTRAPFHAVLQCVKYGAVFGAIYCILVLLPGLVSQAFDTSPYLFHEANLLATALSSFFGSAVGVVIGLVADVYISLVRPDLRRNYHARNRDSR